jgi:hypothetical protein
MSEGLPAMMIINGRPMMPYTGEYLALPHSRGLRWDEQDGRYVSRGSWNVIVRVVSPLPGGHVMAEEYDGYRSRLTMRPGTRPATAEEIRAWHARRAASAPTRATRTA